MIDYARARANMVDSQVRTSDVTDLRLQAALLDVPREAFLPAALRPIAYIDEDLLLKQTPEGDRFLMEPAPFARLVQLATIDRGELVLDIGCGTGYSAAVLARLAESVVALESDPDLAAGANSALMESGTGNVAVVSGDLAAGYPGEGPYDVIVLEGAVDFVPQALFDQLKDGGRLVAVVGTGRAAKAMLYRRVEDVVAGFPAFDCAVRRLPGFAAVPAFVF